MANYINKLGDIYTQEELEAAALENGVDIDTVIADNELTQEGPGKKKSAAAKGSTTVQKKKKTLPTVTNSASSSKSSLSESNGKNPFGKDIKTFSQEVTESYKAKKQTQSANIKNNTKKVSNIVDQNSFGGGSLQDILNPAANIEATLNSAAVSKPKEEWEVLQSKEDEVVNYINSKPIDYTLIDQQYNDEVNDSQAIDNIREGAKTFFNEMVLGPVSMVGQKLGADIDLTISPFKPLEKQKREAIGILTKTKRKGQKVSEAEVNALAKDLFYKEKELIQKGKAAEEYWDDQPLYIKEVAEQKEKLKIRAAQDVLTSSDLARQQTILAQTYSADVNSFNKYAVKFQKKYKAGEVTNEEIETFNVRQASAKKSQENLEGIAANFPKYIDKIKTDEEKLEYFKYNYNDVENSISSLVGTTVSLLGGATKIIGSTIEGVEGDNKGLGGFIGEVGTANIDFGEKLKEDVKRTSFDDVTSFSDFGKYMANLTSEQLPIYAGMFFGGAYGAAAISLGSGGQKINEMENEVGQNYSIGTKLLAGYGYAAAEFIPEKLGTLRMFDNLKDVMSSVNSSSRQIFKEDFIKSTLKSSLYLTGKVGLESQIEGGTEVVTEALDILIDEHLLGKKVSSDQRTKRFKEAYAGGAFMGGGTQFGGGSAILVAKELRNYATAKELSTSKVLMDRIDVLQTELQTNPKLSGKESEEIIAEIKNLTNESMLVIENSEDRVYDMSEKDMAAVLDINRKQQDLRDSYIDLSQSNFSPEIKKAKASELKDEFNALENQREKLLVGQYAEVNRMIGDKAIINSSVDNIKKIVATLDNEQIENSIGNQGSIAVFETTEDLRKSYREWLTTENKITKQKIDSGELPANTKLLSESEINSRVEEAAKSDGFNLDNGQSVVNLSVAAAKGAINVAQHEFLHTVLSKMLKNPIERKKLVNGFLSVLTPKERAVVEKRIEDNYRYSIDEKGNKVENDITEYEEEYLTAFIDAIAYGQIGDKNQVKDVLRRVARPVLKVLQKLGFSNAKFSDAQDLYDFLKDYQAKASKGKISKRARQILEGKPVRKRTSFSKSIEERMDALEEKLMSGEIDYDLYEKSMVALEKEEYELSKKQYEEEKVTVKKEIPKKEKGTELSDAAAKAKAKLDAIGNDPKGFNAGNPDIYSELDKMVKAKSRNWRTANGTIIDFTNKDKGGIDGFDMEEMVSFVRTSMIPYIAKFDPSRNNSLYGYINAQYANRMKAALKSGEVADVVFTEDVSEMTKLSQEEVETTKPTLPERQRYQNILESGVFSPEVIEQIQAKILPIIRTLKSKIDEKVSLNRTVAPIVAEIQNEIGTQADIDIKKAMGGKEGGELRKFLLNNKKAILENMTTTWLMGKDGKGGMPFAIQKKINGQWVNFPDWVGKKIDRESVATDLAGRTAGHELVRRLPNVNKNVDNDTFLASIIDLETGNPIRGRKESLAKAMSEEIAMDIISDDMANEGILFDALQKNQEVLGAAMNRVIEQEFNRLAERGNVKFSKTKELELEWKNALSELNNAKTDESKKSLLLNKNSAFNKFISKIYNLEDEEFKTVKDLILKSIGTKNGIYWWANEKALQRILRKQLKGYALTVRAFGGNNNSVADIVIKEKGDNLTGLNAEAKKAANKNIPITSFTSNSIESKDKAGAFKNSSENVKNTVKEIISYKSDLKDFVGNIGEVTDAGNIKLTKEQFTEVLNKMGSKRYIFKETPVSIEFVKAINGLKFQPNDFIIIKNRIFDYFNGYLGVDNIENAFIGIDNLPENLIDNIFSVKTEFQLTDKTNIASARSYIVFNDKIKLTNNEVIDASGIINEYISKEGENISDFNNVVINNALKAKRDAKYSKSAENNLNLNNDFNYNITNVSDYIKENNIKRINGENAFDVLNDLAKRIEDFWGIVPNSTIEGMNRAVDYAFDVIEDREGDGSMMAALNEGLNLETIKNAEKQLNEFVQNNINKKPLYSKSLDFEFNKMLEENTGVDEFTKISDIVAKRTGRKVNRFSFFVPPSADDFMGLTSYMFSGKGKKGETDQEFFDRNLVVPYVKGINTLDSVRQAIKKSYKELLSQYPDIKKKLEKLTPDGQFTYDQAIRVYLWNKGGIEIPGLSKRDKGKLTFFVKQDLDLIQFANALSTTGRQNGSWIAPSTTWDSETIISDLHNITEGEGRKKWLQEFIENSDAIFSTQNLNKVESIYGTNVRQALEDSLYRMKNGKARPAGTDRLTNIWMNWINGSTAAIMFFNTRSALLQTISSLNFINFSDNNPYQAAKAFADQKQYWSDFSKIINSDKLKERRSGLKSDVTQAEIANAANDAKNKFNGVISYLQKIGFTPTQAADSFAIAVSGATFYRNRVNTYLKNGLTEKEAEDKAWIDFSMITDKSMQSADPMYVSKQQTTALGRLILAFGNTPMQYNRLIKKASLDLINRRGDWKENVSKIIYYGALQNFIFSALQAALFLPFDDEEDDVAEMTKEQQKEYEKLKKKQDDKVSNILNGMLDTVLRGSGVGGAALSTIKNAIVEYNKQEEREMFADHAYTILAATSVSPPISSKLRKLYKIHRTSKFEKDVIQDRGWEVTRDGRLNLSPKYDMVGSGITATTNIPLDRLVEKTNNIAEALDNRNTALQRTALMLGWKSWELNVKNEENEVIKAEAKVERKAEGVKKAVETRKAKKEEEKEAYKEMSTEEKFQYNRKKAKEKIQKRMERKKKKIEEVKAEVAKRNSRRKMG